MNINDQPRTLLQFVYLAPSPALRSCEQDCMELLLPMAAQKLDLSFNIEPDVPPCQLK